MSTVRPFRKPYERKGVPFMWADKRFLLKIRDEVENSATVLSTYSALCEIASDKEKPVFVISHQTIAKKCALSITAVKVALRELARIGAVGSEKQSPKTLKKLPLRYWLLPFNESSPRDANGYRQIAFKRPSNPIQIGTKLASSVTALEVVPSVLENKKKGFLLSEERDRIQKEMKRIRQRASPDIGLTEPDKEELAKLEAKLAVIENEPQEPLPQPPNPSIHPT